MKINKSVMGFSAKRRIERIIAEVQGEGKKLKGKKEV